MRRAVVVALLAIELACGGDSRTLPDQVTRSTWVSYHHWADEPPCPEVLTHMDAVIDFITKRFEVKAGTVDYFKFRESESELVSRICIGGAQSCSERHQAFTKGWMHDHELAHTVFHQVGDPPQLFDEGIAVVLGCGFSGFTGDAIDTTLDLDAFVEDAEFFANSSPRLYDAAGSLVRFLIDAHGAKAFAGFYAHAPSTDATRARKEFETAFGRSMADAVAAWRVSSPPRSGADCLLADDPCLKAPLLEAGTAEPNVQPLSCVPHVVSVAGPDAIAVAVSSSAVPITVVIESCSAQPGRDLVAIAPETMALMEPTLAGITSPGREVELRTLGFSGRARLRITPSRSADLRGAALDPQADPYGGPYSGDLTFRALAEPSAAFSPACPPAAIPLGTNSWGLQVSAPVAALPTGTSQVVLAGAPFEVRARQFTGLSPQFRCGSTCAADPGCPNGLIGTTSATVTRPASPGAERFSLRWIFAR